MSRSCAKQLLSVVVLGLASVLFLAGCGGGGNSGATSGTGDKDREAKADQNRKRELDLKNKIQSLKMPEELAKEWFYDGDGSIDILAQWKADGSKLRLAVGPSTGPGRAKTVGAPGFKQLVGFYVADSPRGPFKYIDRVLGSEFILPSPVTLREVKDRWYRAVTFNDAGAVTAVTPPVQPEVVDMQAPKPAPPPPKKPDTGKTDAAKKGDADKSKPDAKTDAKAAAKTEDKAAEPPPVAKPVVAVLPLTNSAAGDKYDRQYFGRAMGEMIRDFLGSAQAVVEVDPAYVDLVASRQRSRGAYAPQTLTTIAQIVHADVIITGDFETKEDSVRVTFSYVSPTTGAVERSKPLSAPAASADDLGKGLAAELAEKLGATFDDASSVKLAAAWKLLNERRGYIERGLRMHDVDQQTEALAAFDSVKPAEVMDPQALIAMSETYVDRGQPEKAAKALVEASRVTNFLPQQDFYDRMTRVLAQLRDLKAELDLLGSMRGNAGLPVWNAALAALEATIRPGGAPAAGAGSAFSTPTDWPLIRSAWQQAHDGLLLDPIVDEGQMVVFATGDREAMNAFGPGSNPANRNSVKNTYAATDAWDTIVYDAATGAVKWHKDKLMSGVATPVLSGGMIFGMAAKGPICADMKTGDVVWEDKSGTFNLPPIINAAMELGRPGWKTWELARVGPYLVVWHPRENVVYSFEALTGRPIGRSYHNASWGTSGQYFLRQPDGLYFLGRGGGQVRRLTEAMLADPQALTAQLRLFCDPVASVQNRMVVETARCTATDTSRFDYYVSGYDVEKGEFAWLYPIMSKDPPVIADGRLFLYKPDISGRPSTRIQRIDVNAQETDIIDCSGFDISLYEPTIALPDGRGVMIGSQAAITPNGRKLWVNRALPVTKQVRVVGSWLFIPPFLVDPATGMVVYQIEPPAGVRLETVDIAVSDDTLVLLSTGPVRRDKEMVTETRMWAYHLKAPPVEVPPPVGKPEEKPVAPGKVTAEAAEKAFLDSSVAAPMDEHMDELYAKLSQAVYEQSADPKKAAAYLGRVLETRPRNPLHLARIAGMMRPYSAMSADYDGFLKIVGALHKEFEKNASAASAFTALEHQAQAEKSEAAKAREYFEGIKAAPHDPLEDWGSDSPASGDGNRGVSTTLARTLGWKYGPFRNGPEDRILPVGPAVFAWSSAANTLTALNNDTGAKMWERPGVLDVVYYRGILYVLGVVPGAKEEFELRALTPVTNLTLWHKRLDFPVTKTTPLSAGNDLVFFAGPEDVVAVDWATGLDVWRQSVSQRERLDVHGSALITSNRQGKLVALDAKKGERLWAKDVGSYSLYDGKLYSCTTSRDGARTELELTACLSLSGRELYRKSVELPVVRRNPADVMPPVVTWDSVFVVADANLVQFDRAKGTVGAKQTLSGLVTRPITSAPGEIYLIQADQKFVAYDVSTELSPVYTLQIAGQNTAVAADGSLYLINQGEVRCYRGQRATYPPEHLKALATPNEADTGGDTLPALQDTSVSKGRFIAIGSVRGNKELFGKLDDKRLGEIAFAQIVNVGRFSDWKVMLDELDSRLPPGERKTRPLTMTERGMLYAELIQRRDSQAADVVRDALKSGNRQAALMALDLMTTGDRSVFGPLLQRVFKEAIDAKDQMTAIFAADAVGRWKHEPAMAQLISALDDSRQGEGLRQGCAKALAHFDKPDATRALLKVAMEDARNALPKVCTDLLAERDQGPEGIKALVGLLVSSSAKEPNRVNAALALARARTSESNAALLQAVRSTSYPAKVRGVAAAAMAPAAKESDDVLNALDAIMEDPKADPYLRNACMNGIGFSDNPKAIPMIIGVMGNRDVDNNKFAAIGVYEFARRLTHVNNIGQYPDQWQAWWEKNKDRYIKP